MTDVQMGSLGTHEAEESSDVEFADPVYPDSELVPDMLSKRAHRLLDEKVLRRYTWTNGDEKDENSIYSRITLLRSLARDYDRLDPELTQSYDAHRVARRCFEKHPWLVSVLNECWKKGSFRTVRLLKILQCTHVSYPKLNIEIVERSWDRKFEGPAADVLLQTISTHLTKTQTSSSSRTGYANCAPLVNSSGTGKSRMVDELSKRVITIPMCLRGKGTQGFPPYDGHLRLWLERPENKCLSERQRLREFIVSLLTVTKERLVRIEHELSDSSIPQNELDEENLVNRQEKLASAFREHMRDGQNFNGTGQYRMEFFEEVIDRVENRINNSPTDIRGLQYAGENLVNFIFPPKGSCWENGLRRPIVILAFDEAHQLALREYDYSMNQYWIRLSELRYVLRELHDLPIFTLLLSTSASKLQPLNAHDIGNLPPITHTGFDVLAYVAEEGVTTLDEVTQEKWMCHLGRPLFAADYDSWEAIVSSRKKASDDYYEDLLCFAESKLLLASPAYKPETPALLACLSVRFALVFDFLSLDAREMEATLVEAHMRLCPEARPGFDSLTLSTAPLSEPFLAKAAANILDRPDTPVTRLVTQTELSCIYCGERGELLSSLLVMRARDVAHAESGRLRRYRREWVYVREFMQALLPPDAYNVLRATLPACHLPNEQNAPFATTFDDAKIWFNHVIKVEHGEMIHISHLWEFISRGGMIICTPRYHNLDIVLPVCFKGNKLSRDNTTAVLIQLKLDKCDPSGGFYNENMNPFDVGLFSKEDKPLPVIRMVFALGSDETGVTFPTQGNSNPTSLFTSYDICCAGLSPRTFACIGDDLSAYQTVLRRSRRVLKWRRRIRASYEETLEEIAQDVH